MSTSRTRKWQRRMLNYLTLAGPDGLTLRQLRNTRKMTRLDATDEWMRRKLELLEDRCLVWYNPESQTYHSRADEHARSARPRTPPVGGEVQDDKRKTGRGSGKETAGPKPKPLAGVRGPSTHD